MAGIGIENYASDHDMSNQQSEKPDLPQHKPGSPWENWSLPTNFAASLFGTLGPFQTLRASGYLQLRSFTCFALQVLYLAWYRGAKFTKNKMINGVVLQTPGSLLTACFREPRQVCLNCAGL